MHTINKGFSIGTLKRGLMAGLNITWELSMILIPIYFIVTFLKYTPVIGWISTLFTPFMGLFGLPGEAAIVLVMGNILGMYAAIGAMAPLSLPIREISILAIMLTFSHSLPVETVLTKKIGISAVRVIAVRVTLAVISGVAFNLIL